MEEGKDGEGERERVVEGGKGGGSVVSPTVRGYVVDERRRGAAHEGREG